MFKICWKIFCILLVSVSTDFWIKFLIFLFQIGVYCRCLFTLYSSACLRVFSILIDLTHTNLHEIYTKNKLGSVNLQRIKDKFSDDTWTLMGMDNVGMNFCFQKTGSRRDFTRSCNGSRAIFLLTGLRIYLSFESIWCSVGHFDPPPSRNSVKLCASPLNPILIRLFEFFLQ